MSVRVWAAVVSLWPVAGLAAECGAVCSHAFWVQPEALILEGLVGIDVNARDAEGKTPLIWALQAGTPDAAMALIDAGADVNVQDVTGLSALHLSTAKPVEIMQALLAAGADVTLRTQDAQTALHYAATGWPEFSETLLAAGAEIEARDSNGCTPLHYAAGAREADMLPVLIAAGADVRSLCDNGQSVLFSAATARHAENIAILAAAGADPAVVEANGQTPLHRAAMFGAGAANIEALLDAGVDPSVRNGQGQTAWDLAKGRADLAGTVAARRLEAGAQGE